MASDTDALHTTAHLLCEVGGRPVLLGSRCLACGEHYFPETDSCTRCSTTDLTPCELGSEGLLWSWTIQGFLPKEPYNSGESSETFTPYGVGYVEMPSGIKVESRLTCADPQRLRIGMPMQLVSIVYGQHADSGTLRTFAFAPVGSTSSLEAY